MCVKQMTFVSCLLIGLAHSHAVAKEGLDDVIRDLRAYAAQAKALNRADAAGIQKLDDKVDDLSWRISTSSESRGKKADAARKAVLQLQEYLRNKPYEGDSKSAIQQELSVCERLAPALPRGDDAKRKTVENHLTQLTLRVYRVADASAKEKGALHDRIATVRKRLKELENAGQPQLASTKDNRGPLTVDPPLGMQKFTGKEIELKEKMAIGDRLTAVLDRYDQLPRPVDIGRELELSTAESRRLLADTDRFLREFHAMASQWRNDKAEALRVYRQTDSGWFQASQLSSSVPYSLNGQVWHSRFYLEAVFEEAFDASEFRTGKDRTIVIINDGGQKAVSFKSGGATKECLQFTYDAAKIGLYFAQKIGDDPAPWHKRWRATEALADEYSVPLKGRK